MPNAIKFWHSPETELVLMVECQYKEFARTLFIKMVFMVLFILRLQISQVVLHKGHSHLRELAGYKSQFLHRDRNLKIFTSVDIKISLIIAISIMLQIAIHIAIICIAADVWTLEHIILVLSIPSFQASISKQGQCLISGMHSSVTRIIPLGDQWDISACLNKRKNISVFQSRWKSRSFLCMNAPIYF